jgi:hypothetical protein
MFMTSFTLMFLTGGVVYLFGIDGREPLVMKILQGLALGLGVVAWPYLMLRAPRATMGLRTWMVAVFGVEAIRATLNRLGLPVWLSRAPIVAYGLALLGILVSTAREGLL